MWLSRVKPQNYHKDSRQNETLLPFRFRIFLWDWFLILFFDYYFFIAWYLLFIKSLLKNQCDGMFATLWCSIHLHPPTPTHLFRSPPLALSLLYLFLCAYTCFICSNWLILWTSAHDQTGRERVLTVKSRYFGLPLKSLTFFDIIMGQISASHVTVRIDSSYDSLQYRHNIS